MFEEHQLQIGKQIGAGNEGMVYRSLDLTSGRVVALKKIPIPKGDQQKRSKIEVNNQLYQQEVKIMVGLQHENITNTKGFLHKEFEMWLLMDYANLGCIESLCNTFGPLEEQTVAVYLRQILSGLDYLHDHKVIHRDIKPSNLLLTDEGVVKLSDFGSFYRMETSQTVDDMVSTLKGSIMYMAPEAAQQSSPSRKSDIWSLGCVVLEMSTGKKPWSELQFDNLYAALMVIATSGKSPIVPNSLSDDLKDFLAKCFIIDSKERPTAKDLLQHPFLKKYHTERSPSQTSLPNIQ